MRRFQPALLGGLVIGVLSSLPVVGRANVCCCLWVVVGGLVTAYLQQQAQPDPLDAADAALGGLMAGIAGAILYIIAAGLLLTVSGPAVQAQLRAALDQNPQMPPEMRAMMINLFAGHGVLLVMVAIVLPVYAVFSMLGALLGLAIFRKKAPPAPPAPPAAPTP